MKLLPCPFCGSAAKTESNSDYTHGYGSEPRRVTRWQCSIFCTGCRLFGGSEFGYVKYEGGNALAHQYAIRRITERWNRRAALASKPQHAEPLTHVIGIDPETGKDKIVRLKVPLYTAPQPPAGEQKPVGEGFFTPDGECINASATIGYLGLAHGDAERGCTIRPLYGPPQPEQVAQDREDAERWRWMWNHAHNVSFTHQVNAYTKSAVMGLHCGTLKDTVDAIRAAREKGDRHEA